MPRKARVISKTGIYHIVLRGINQQQIFYEEDDYNKFLQLLKDNKDICVYKLFAYCLMGNHIHLLLKEEKETIGQIIKRIGTNFVYWYNIKYQRIGHLFQDRFKSEPIEDKEHLLSALRYIHQNPIKAGICKNISEYKYSSYLKYVKADKFIDYDFIYQYISDEYFEEYHNQLTNEKYLDIEDNIRKRLTDEQVEKFLIKQIKIKSIIEFQNAPDKKKEECVVKLYNKGASIRQLSRLTGISKKIIEKWLKRAE